MSSERFKLDFESGMEFIFVLIKIKNCGISSLEWKLIVKQFMLPADASREDCVGKLHE